MTLADLQNQLIPEIEMGLRDFVNSHEFGRSAELQAMITYHMGWADDEDTEASRGKRIRPLLVLLSAGACDGTIQKAMPAALAIELLHNFTLIHDDIEDRSPLRHGRPTLWQRWGIAQAVNAGDALFSIAQLAMLELSETCSPEIAAQAARHLNQICLQLTRGQFLDIAFEDDNEIEIETYLDMIHGKTAALIAFSAAVGGIVSGQHQETVNRLSIYGESLGLAFQIQDDYLGIWGDPQVTGKSAASDLMARKKTLPILFGLEKCADFKTLWSQTEFKTGDIDQMSDLLAACGAQEYVREQAATFTQQAFTSLEMLFPNPNEYARALQELTQKLLHRDN